MSTENTETEVKVEIEGLEGLRPLETYPPDLRAEMEPILNEIKKQQDEKRNQTTQTETTNTTKTETTADPNEKGDANEKLLNKEVPKPTGNPFIDSIIVNDLDNDTPEIVFDDNVKQYLSKNAIEAPDFKTLTSTYKSLKAELEAKNKENSQLKEAVEFLKNIEENPDLLTAIDKFKSGENVKEYMKSIYLSELDYTKPFEKQKPNAIVDKYFSDDYIQSEYDTHEDFIESIKSTSAYRLAEKDYNNEKQGKFTTKENINQKAEQKKQIFFDSINQSVNQFVSENPNFVAKSKEITDIMGGQLFSMFLKNDGTFSNEAPKRVATLLYADETISYLKDAYTKKDQRVKELESQVEEFVRVNGGQKNTYSHQNTPKISDENKALIEQLRMSGLL